MPRKQFEIVEHLSQIYVLELSFYSLEWMKYCNGKEEA